MKWLTAIFDAINAYLHVIEDEEVYCEPPEEWLKAMGVGAESQEFRYYRRKAPNAKAVSQGYEASQRGGR